MLALGGAKAGRETGLAGQGTLASYIGINEACLPIIHSPRNPIASVQLQKREERRVLTLSRDRPH